MLTLAVVQRAVDLARYRWTFLAAGVALLVMPLVPGLGSSFGGARIWVSVGPVNFQPGEFAKIVLAIFFASYLADNRQLISGATWRVGPLRLPEPRYLLPVAAAWAFAVLVMVAEKDLGSSLLFFTLFVVMLWVSTERALYLVIGVILFGTVAFVSWRMFDHVQLRVDIWLDPWADRNDRGYQLVQAIYGMSDGGIMGTGLGRGSPDIVPVAESDFIFTSIAEELGLFGGAAVLMCYLLLVGAGLRVALRTENAFEKLLAVGLTTIMGHAGVHHRRRRHQARAADRHHAPVRELRRLVAGVELRAARVVDPAQRLDGAAAPRDPRRPDDGRALGRQATSPFPAASRGRRERVMNQRIRQLAFGMMALYVAAVRGDELLAGRAGFRLNGDADNYRGDPPRVRPPTRRDHHGRWCRGRVVGGEPAGQ